jgi:hypothetical protein
MNVCPGEIVGEWLKIMFRSEKKILKNEYAQ